VGKKKRRDKRQSCFFKADNIFAICCNNLNVLVTKSKKMMMRIGSHFLASSGPTSLFFLVCVFLGERGDLLSLVSCLRGDLLFLGASAAEANGGGGGGGGGGNASLSSPPTTQHIMHFSQVSNLVKIL
jgi:hypothetical protein